MDIKSHLILDTGNRILDTLSDFQEGSTLILKNYSLAKMFNVSRTTIRTVILELEKKGVVDIQGAEIKVLRASESEDYFDISHSVSSKEEIIEAYFLDLINHGKLLPGSKFSELELAKASGCNTITVREYLIKFSRLGLIEKRPRSKWHMVEFDESFALELVEFRRILEMSSVTKLLSIEKTDVVWNQLAELLKQHLEVLADVENRYTEFSELDKQFHYVVQRASKNRFFMQFFDVVSLICHYHYQWNKDDELERNKVALEEHVEIITQLLAHNTSGTIIALEQHLNTAQKTLLHSVHGLE